MRSAPTQTHDNARCDERAALYSEAEAAVLIFFRIESGRAVPLLCVLYITYVLYCIMLCYHIIFFYHIKNTYYILYTYRKIRQACSRHRFS